MKTEQVLSNCRTLYCAVLILLCLVTGADHAVAEGRIKPFSSDGCSLFPDGTIDDRTKWCDCCLSHDIAYWQGGTEEVREKADEELRNCVFSRTNDKALAETMYLGVRAGGHPAFPTGYRWAYGWSYGRGYQVLTAAEQQQARKELNEYKLKHPTGYCGEHGSETTGTSPAQDRPAAWATPVQSEHLKNFYKLDNKVYRSAQPNKKGFKELAALGIRNVLSFRDYHSDDDGKNFGLNLFRVKMEAGDITLEKVVEALRVIRNSNGPILIHCWHGSDRTGLISAMYRIVFQNRSKDDAIEELMNGGYGYHSLYKNIPEFIRHVDVEEIRKLVLTL